METSPEMPEMAGQLALSHKKLEVINALLQLSLQDLPLPKILQHTLNLLATIPWLGLQSRGAIFLVENQAEMLTFKAQIGMESSIQTACGRVPFGQCLCGLAAATRKIQFAPTCNGRHRAHLDQVPPHGHYCIPIMLGERLLGVMNLSVRPDHVRSEKEEEFLTSAAHALAGILARQEAEEARNRSEQEFKFFLKNVPAIVFKGYADGSVDLFNDKVEEMTGYPKALFSSKSIKWTDLILPEDYDNARAKFIKALRGLKSYVREYRIRRKNGRIAWVQERSHIVLNSASRINYISGVLFDITIRKRGEEALKRSFLKLQESLKSTVMALVSALEMRDPYTAGHQRRVTQLACAIGKELGFSKKQTEGLRMIGILHDIGKIAVPAEILTKPGKIGEHEFSLIKTHTEAGFNIVKDIAFPCPVAEAIAQHHERLDGSGYPRGLSGSEIIIQARILAVADVVEAMASHRPYRPGLGIEMALEEITKQKGILYDPEVVDACIRVFNEKRFEFE